MSVDLESRPTPAPTQSSPTFRQTGFSVPATSTASTQEVNATATSSQPPVAPRSRPSNSSLNAALHARGQSGSLGRGGAQRPNDDGDAEMTEANEVTSLQPLAIPVKLASGPLAKPSQSPNDLATPPDTMTLPTHKPSPNLSTSAVRLPPLNSSLISPRFSALHGSSVSSGPASATSSHWSPGRSSDPHLYSISSGRKYSYTSFKPSLSTSFKTSAERGRSTTAFDDEDEDEDDSFGKPPGGPGLVSDHKTSERSVAIDAGEEGDASGVFSFSSPCFGPKQLDNEQVPSPDLNETLPSTSTGGEPPSGVLSPSWATASLGKLSLGSPEARTPISSSLRRGSRPQHSHSYGQTNHASGSMPTSADAAVHAAMQQRRYSYNKSVRPSLSSGPSSYTYSTSFGRDSVALARHPYARIPISNSYGAAVHRASRSRSRNRYGTEERRPGRLDDDETDEEMRLDEEDDDATEDEADYSYARYPAGRNAYGRSIPRAVNDRSRSNTPSNASLGLTFQMSPGSSSLLGKGLPLESSSSRPGLLGVSLSRQYSSDRHPPGASLAPHRHHPYATSPNGASGTTGPLSASMGLSYSPGSNAPLSRPVHRRGSSLGNGLAAPGFAGGLLSTSPRYANSNAHRGTAPYAGEDPGEPGSYTASSSFTSGSPFAAGQRMDSAGKYFTPAPGRSYGHSPAPYAVRNNGYVVGGTAQSPPIHERADRLHAGFGAHERTDSMASEATEGPGTARSPTTPSLAAARSNSNTGASGNVDETAQVAAIRDRLGGAASCSAFISKLWLLMINPDLYSRYIRWDEAGTSIILSSEPDIANEFASDVLPKLFKHGNNASFVRQLNLYGFQRIPSSRLLDPTEMKVAAARRAELGGNGATGALNTAVQLYGAHSSFAHPRFRRGHEELLPTMKPRSSKKPKKSNGSVNTGQSPPKADLVRMADGDETDEEDFALS